MANIRDLIDGLFVYFPTAPEPLLVRMWRRTARDFFMRTKAWVKDADVINVSSDFTEYTLGINADPEVEMFDIAPRGLSIGGTTDVKIVSQPKFNNYRSVPAGTFGGTEYYATFKYPDVIEVGPARNVNLASTISVRVAVRPTDSATTMDDDVAFRFKEAIESGTIANTLLLPQQPWMVKDAYGRNNATVLYNIHKTLYLDHVDTTKALAPDGMHVGVARRVTYGGY